MESCNKSTERRRGIRRVTSTSGLAGIGLAAKTFVLSLTVTGLLAIAPTSHADETFQQCLSNAESSHERSECYWARSRQQRGR